MPVIPLCRKSGIMLLSMPALGVRAKYWSSIPYYTCTTTYTIPVYYTCTGICTIQVPVESTES